ncbi:MAG: LysR substrate-binding domain-containing protein [Actinomycetota bacterium]|nr:LysR substrate-binding domain-containing protein [Actinomycetota bacterium]
MSAPFRLGFVTGATPDKWARTWRERRRDPLELVPVDEATQEVGVREGTLDMALVRLPVDRENLHCIPLYDELPVVVAGAEHLVAAADHEVVLDDLADEQLVRPHASGWTPRAEQLSWPPMTEKDAIETVAGGTGVVIVPMSVARLYARKDVVQRPVADLPPTKVGLVWLIDNHDERVQVFIGIVRGRTERSTRG